VGAITYSDHSNTGSTETIDASAADVHRLVLNAATVTITLTGWPASGTYKTIRVLAVQDGTGGRVFSWPGTVVNPPTLSTGASTIDEFDLETWDGGTTVYVRFQAGPTGATGPAGATGPTGPTGATGATGGGGNSFTQIVAVKRTAGDLTTTSTSFVDATGLTATLTTAAVRCLVTFFATLGAGNASATCAVTLLVDGVNQGGTYGLVAVGNTTVDFMGSFTFWTDVLSAGSHTIKIQFRNDSGNTATIRAASNKPAVFQVVETTLAT
jgi:hypothetical protein